MGEHDMGLILRMRPRAYEQLLCKLNVQRPGSRGGKYWFDKQGAVRYGEKPDGRTTTTGKPISTGLHPSLYQFQQQHNDWTPEEHREAAAAISQEGTSAHHAALAAAHRWTAKHKESQGHTTFGQEKVMAAVAQSFRDAAPSIQSLLEKQKEEPVWEQPKSTDLPKPEEAPKPVAEPPKPPVAEAAKPDEEKPAAAPPGAPQEAERPKQEESAKKPDAPVAETAKLGEGQAATAPPEAPQEAERPPETWSRPSYVPRAAKASRRIYEMDIDDLHMDPARFQFKETGRGGVTARLKKVSTWEELFSGVTSAWHDPEDGKTYIVNGHHRLDLARRLGVKHLDVQFLDVPNAKEARTLGALINMAEGQGSPIDAAKIIRDTGMNAETLQRVGLSEDEPVAQTGMALAQLHTALFRRVINRTLSVSRGAMIGPLKESEQLAIMRDMDAREAKGKKELNDKELAELIDEVKHAGERTVVQHTLFGDDVFQQSLASERAILTNHIKEQLAKEKYAFKHVSDEERAKTLERGGNIIDVAQSKKIADAATLLLGQFEKEKRLTGPVSSALNAAARRLSEEEKKDKIHAIKRDIYERVRGLLREAFARGTGAGAERTEEGAGESGVAQETDDRTLSLFGKARLWLRGRGPWLVLKAEQVGFGVGAIKVDSHGRVRWS